MHINTACPLGCFCLAHLGALVIAHIECHKHINLYPTKKCNSLNRNVNILLMPLELRQNSLITHFYTKYHILYTAFSCDAMPAILMSFISLTFFFSPENYFNHNLIIIKTFIFWLLDLHIYFFLDGNLWLTTLYFTEAFNVQFAPHVEHI